MSREEAHRLARSIPPTIKRIAITGAGPSGIAAAKHLLATLAFDTVDIYEQQAEVGGVWNYNNLVSPLPCVPQTSPHVSLEEPVGEHAGAPVFANPMYDNLHTNLPKTLMCFPDKPFGDCLLFPTRQDVQAYLVEYAEDVRHLIAFSTRVLKVEPLLEHGRRVWQVEAKSYITGEVQCKKYDAVVLASGHFAVPFIPDVKGIQAFHQAYPDIISHSSSYRHADCFKGKKVIVVGGSASGLDIAMQISMVSRLPVLNSLRSLPALEVDNDQIKQVPMIEEYIEKDGIVRFSDGSIEAEVDAVVYCTGYLFAYPMLKGVEPPLISNGQRVLGVYKQLFSIEEPTLAFPTLPYKIVPFPIADVQAAVIARVWSGHIQLPTREEMKESERSQVETLGDGRAFHILGYPNDADYIDELATWANTARNAGKAAVGSNARQRWLRERCFEMRAYFGQDGNRAKTMEELGYIYDGDDQDATLRNSSI